MTVTKDFTGKTDPTLAHQMAARALAWLDESRQYFALPNNIPSHQLYLNDTVKPLGELGAACAVVVREGVAGSQEARIAPSLMEFAWQQFKSGDVLYEIQLCDPGQTAPLEMYVPFARMDYRNDKLDELLAHLSDLQLIKSLDQTCVRQLAVVNGQQILGLTPYTDLVALARQTWLGYRPEPWLIDFSTAYAMTHVVLHVTDWGGRSEAMPSDLEDYLQLWLPVWLDVYTEAQQWDLVGEMLIVDLSLRSPQYYPEIWSRYADAQQADGLVPAGPEPPSRDVEKAFRDHYHPTIVAAVAGTLAVSRAMASPAAHT